VSAYKNLAVKMAQQKVSPPQRRAPYFRFPNTKRNMDVLKQQQRLGRYGGHRIYSI